MIFASLALALQAAAAPPALTLDQNAAVRCAAAMALTAQAQVRGEPAATALPPLGERGREYFVRVSARLMDDLGLDRDQIASLFRQHAGELARSGEATGVARACLPLLDTAGL